MFYIAHIGFIGVCLTFKADVQVGGFLVFVFEVAHAVFNNIPDIKGQDKQLCLLPQVYALMVKQHGVGSQRFIPYKYKREQCYGGISLRD